MATQRYGYNTSYTDNVTEYTGAEIARLHKISDTQGGMALEAFGVGVLKDPDENSLKVSAGTGRSVKIAPGRGFARHSTYGGFAFENSIEATLSPLAASSTVYIFAALNLSPDTRETGDPAFVVGDSDEMDGGLLLAEVVVGVSSIASVTDRRIFVSLGEGGSVPTGTGVPKIVAGVQQAAASLISNADVASDAAIAESKLALASDAVAGTASRRTLGTGAQQAAAGNHTHSLATVSTIGFMSGTDKTRLDAATASPTASTLMARDVNGRAQVAAPSADADIATKKYVDDATTAGAPDAGVGTKGITELSVAPLGEPIAVGDNDPRLQPFVASGTGHTSGMVPDPGVTEGSSKFLCEDATWKTPPGGSLSVAQDGGATVNNVDAIIYDGGTVTDNEDGSVTVTHTPATIGAAEASHASTHANGGADEISIDASQVTSGVFNIARLATGTPDGTKFVRDDGTLAVPPGGGGGGGLGAAGAVEAHVTGTQSIPNNSATAVSFGATGTDDAGYWNAGTPTKLIVPAGYAGRHDVNALVEFPTNSTGNRSIAIYKNGSDITGLIRFAASPTNDTNIGISWTLDLEEGDEVEVYVSQTSGGALNVQPYTAIALTRLAVVDEINALQIQGHDVAATAPSDGQVLAWNDTASEYQPVDQTGGSGGTTEIELTAGETIAARQPVYIELDGAGGTAGRAYLMDATSSAKSIYAWLVGFATEAADAGDLVSIQLIGILDGFTGLTPGAVYYADTTPGDITSVAPANARRVGVAINSTELLINARGSNDAVAAATGVRGYIAGGQNGSSEVATTDKLTFGNDTTALQSSANLPVARQLAASLSDAQTKAYFYGGYTGSGNYSSVDKLTFVNDTNAATGGTPSSARHAAAGLSQRGTKGYVAGGWSSGNESLIDRVMFNTDTWASMSENLTFARRDLVGVNGGPDKGYWTGGSDNSSTYYDQTDKHVFSTEVVTAESGADLSAGRAFPAAASDGISHAIVAGGRDGSSVATADKITFSTDTTSAQVSANLSVARNSAAGLSQGSVKGYFLGGDTGSVSAVADKVDFSTDTTAAQSSANLSSARAGTAGASDTGL